MASFDAVVLVGHGGVPTDMPTELVAELKQLESARQRQGLVEMTAREAELDHRVRTWPRDARTDPYRAGLERLAACLRPRVAPAELVVAYNEFCAPSLEQAVAQLVARSMARIAVVTTMFTPGGSHSEAEIPAAVAALSDRYPRATIRYAWPYDLEQVAALLASHLAAES